MLRALFIMFIYEVMLLCYVFFFFPAYFITVLKLVKEKMKERRRLSV